MSGAAGSYPEGAQAVGFEHAPDTPTAHLVAFGLHYGPQPTLAVALAVAHRRRAHGGLPGRFRNQLALLPVPGVVRAGRDL